MIKNIGVKEIVSYKGHSIKTNGNMELAFTAMYDQLTKSIEILQLLNNNIKIFAKLSGNKPIYLGEFSVKNVLFDGDGESIIKFISTVDFVELNNLNTIISQENFQIKLEANIELEEEE